MVGSPAVPTASSRPAPKAFSSVMSAQSGCSRTPLAALAATKSDSRCWSRSTAMTVAPSSANRAQSTWPIPPAAPVMSAVLPESVIMDVPRWSGQSGDRRARGRQPGMVVRSQMAEIVEREVADPVRAERRDGGEQLLLAADVGVAGAQDGAERGRRPSPPPAVDEVGQHAARVGLVEADRQLVGRTAEQGEVAALFPAGGRGPPDRGDDPQAEAAVHRAADRCHEAGH